MKIDSLDTIIVLFIIILIVYIIINICGNHNNKSNFADTNNNNGNESENVSENVSENENKPDLASTVLIASSKHCKNNQYRDIKDITNFQEYEAALNNDNDNNNKISLMDEKYYSSQVKDYCKSNKYNSNLNNEKPKTILDHKIDELKNEYQNIINNYLVSGGSPDDINYANVDTKLEEIKNICHNQNGNEINYGNGNINGDNNRNNNLNSNNINEINNNTNDDNERNKNLIKYNYLIRMRNKYF